MTRGGNGTERLAQLSHFSRHDDIFAARGFHEFPDDLGRVDALEGQAVVFVDQCPKSAFDPAMVGPRSDGAHIDQGIDGQSGFAAHAGVHNNDKFRDEFVRYGADLSEVNQSYAAI